MTKVLLTTKVGGLPPQKVLERLNANGMRVAQGAVEVVRTTPWQPKQTLTFTKATVRDLGFEERPTLEQINSRIKEMGHQPCQDVDGPAIRLALSDRNELHMFSLAMEPVKFQHDRLGVFTVNVTGDDCKLTLGLDYFHKTYIWKLTQSVVFRLNS